MVSDGAKGRRVRALSAELALKTLRSDLGQSTRLRSVIEQALVFTGATHVAVYAPSETGGQLCLVASAGVPRVLHGLRQSYATDGGSPMAVAVRQDRVVTAGPAEVARLVGNGAAETPEASLTALPLRADHVCVGCLVAVTDQPGGFDADDRQSLELFATAIGHPGPTPGDACADTDPVAGAESRATGFTLDMDTGWINVGDDVLTLFGLEPAAFDGRVETLLALTVPEDLPALMSVVEAGHMATGDRELEFRIRRPSGELRWLRLRGRVLFAPDGRPVRLLGTVGDASRMRAGVNDVGRVQQLAADLANASTVRDVSTVVVASLRRPLNADRIALAELENDRLVVTVLDPADPSAWPEVWRTEWRSEWPDAPTRSMPTLATALREGRVGFWPAGAPLESTLAGVGPGGLAVLPLPAAGRVVGCCIIGWDEPHEFGADERAVLTAAAGLVGQALVRVRAFDAEHELVGTLQRTLLPRRLPVLPGGVAVARYLPTTGGLEVGGDWYDVIPLHDHHVALVIGDVQGHNAGAATLMGQMRTAIRAYAVEGHSPDVVVSHANRLLVGMETDLFATCCYVSIDMEEGSAWCVRAGHLPPVLRLPDGGTRTVEGDGGPPLGVVDDADFPLIPLRLQIGTVLALTTDGLVESAELPWTRACSGCRASCPRPTPPTWAAWPTPCSAPPPAATTWRCCSCATTAWPSSLCARAGLCGGSPTPPRTPAASPPAPCARGGSARRPTRCCWSSRSWSPTPWCTPRARYGWTSPSPATGCGSPSATPRRGRRSNRRSSTGTTPAAAASSSSRPCPPPGARCRSAAASRCGARSPCTPAHRPRRLRPSPARTPPGLRRASGGSARPRVGRRSAPVRAAAVACRRARHRARRALGRTAPGPGKPVARARGGGPEQR